MDIQAEVAMFDDLVKKTSGFVEGDVKPYGLGSPLHILSSMGMVSGDGIKYKINNVDYVFDTVEHIVTFMSHGLPDNISPWIRGGILGDFVKTFGVDASVSMMAKYGDMVGIIPQLIISSSRKDLRACHGIGMRDGTQPLDMQYEFWRPILLAKYLPAGDARDALLCTGTSYLIDKDASSMEWSGKITYPEPSHSRSCIKVEDCTCNVPNASQKKKHVCPLNKAYVTQKKAGQRTAGVLVGNNRMGKYLMAIRSEIRLLDKKRKGVEGMSETKKKKKT